MDQGFAQTSILAPLLHQLLEHSILVLKSGAEIFQGLTDAAVSSALHELVDHPILVFKPLAEVLESFVKVFVRTTVEAIFEKPSASWGAWESCIDRIKKSLVPQIRLVPALFRLSVIGMLRGITLVSLCRIAPILPSRH